MKRVEFTETDLSHRDVGLPEGWKVASIGRYADGKGLRGQELGYTVSVQLFNVNEPFNVPRGTGNSFEEAFADAVSKIRRKN